MRKKKRNPKSFKNISIRLFRLFERIASWLKHYSYQCDSSRALHPQLHCASFTTMLLMEATESQGIPSHMSPNDEIMEELCCLLRIFHYTVAPYANARCIMSPRTGTYFRSIAETNWFVAKIIFIINMILEIQENSKMILE